MTASNETELRKGLAEIFAVGFEATAYLVEPKKFKQILDEAIESGVQLLAQDKAAALREQGETKPAVVAKSLMGQLIAEIAKFGGDTKDHASQLARILLPHIESYVQSRTDEALRKQGEAMLAVAPEKRNEWIHTEDHQNLRLDHARGFNKAVAEYSAAIKNQLPTDQYLCQSYYDDAGVLQDCSCGKCGEQLTEEKNV